MSRPSLLVKPSPVATRLLLTSGPEEMLRAVLPPPLDAHPRAAATLYAALSLWVQRPLSVVLFVAARASSSGLGLCGPLGFGHRAVHYGVEVVDPAHRRSGLGPFRDLRQLALRGVQ
jgi:hypothetical protein